MDLDGVREAADVATGDGDATEFLDDAGIQSDSAQSLNQKIPSALCGILGSARGQVNAKCTSRLGRKVRAEEGSYTELSPRYALSAQIQKFLLKVHGRSRRKGPRAHWGQFCARQRTLLRATE